MLDYRLSIAPMMGYTHRYYRYLIRSLTKQTLLFTEMLTEHSVLGLSKKNNEKSRFRLGFHAVEAPVIFQIGGQNPEHLGSCATIIEDLGYAGINLNLGCPSPKVQKGCFGVALMPQVERVASIIHAIKKSCSIPISIKTRIGVDEHDSFEFLRVLLSACAQAGCEVFFMHARKAILAWDPKKNRDIPPLDYAKVRQLKQYFPKLKFILNGGLSSIAASFHMLSDFDGVMIGRAAIQDPLQFHMADAYLSSGEHGHKLALQDKRDSRTIAKAIQSFLGYFASLPPEAQNFNLAQRTLSPLFYGYPRARYWRSLIQQCLEQAKGTLLASSFEEAYEQNFLRSWKMEHADNVVA